jgi:hypothetical protein
MKDILSKYYKSHSMTVESQYEESKQISNKKCESPGEEEKAFLNQVQTSIETAGH